MKTQKHQTPRWIKKVGEMLNKKREKPLQQTQGSQEKPNEESNKTT